MNKTIDYQFTIVIPVYNEEENIYLLEEKLSDFLPQCVRHVYYLLMMALQIIV